jgi:hypothetical protein
MKGVNNKLKCPCKGCEKRTQTCHGMCQEYEDYKIERAAINDYNRERNQVTVSDYSIRRYWLNRRLSKRKYVVNK